MQYLVCRPVETFSQLWQWKSNVFLHILYEESQFGYQASSRLYLLSSVDSRLSKIYSVCSIMTISTTLLYINDTVTELNGLVMYNTASYSFAIIASALMDFVLLCVIGNKGSISVPQATHISTPNMVFTFI